MNSNNRNGKIAGLICVSGTALGMALAASPVQARCTNSGTALDCDTTIPNPDSVAAAVTVNTVNVAAGATLTSTQSATLSPAGTPVVITNSGTIQTTNATGRAINIAGANNSRSITVTNNAGGLITSADDAVRVNFNPTGGTITVNNAGVIKTTNGGQALDFDAAASGSATIVINNLVTGELRSFGQDGIRPGQGAVVNNAGLIFSDGLANNSYDGVDWQGKSGTVNNLATGTISGLRHGITSDIDVNVVNAGTILGRNGSGVGSDGTGTVTNTGTITGQWDGVAINGDGDGVDIDFIGSVTNSGTIQGLSATGVDSGGRPNSAEGIAMGGGTIVNNAGALVFGAGNAVLINHDTNPGGVADGATTITNAGTIRAGTGKAIQFVGAFNDTITNSGTITGGTGGAIDMGDGNDTLNLLTGSVITGTVDGGTGIDAITLGGSGSGSFAGAVNFESLAVNSGTWTVTGISTFANGVSVNQGRLVLAGTLSGTMTVQNGGTLAGNGAVGATTVASGGTIAPGNSIGTITVNGAFTAQAGSTYVAETTVAGASDLIAVNGAATLAAGARLQVVRDGGIYAIGQRYTVLTATGGVSGAYTVLQDGNAASEFRFGKTANTAFVDVARTAASLPGIGVTANQRAAATGLAGQGVANAAYAALTLIPSDDAVRAGLDGLSGEIHSTILTTLLNDAVAAQTAVRGRLTDDAAGSGIWMTGLRTSGSNNGDGSSARASNSGWGLLGGVDAALGDHARVGIAGGASWTDLTVSSRASSARADSAHLLAYAGATFGGLRLNVTGGYAWGNVDTRRAVAFTGFADSLTASYKARTIHGSADLGYRVPLGGGSVEPFAAIEAYSVRRGAFAETGGAAALASGERQETHAITTLGARFSTPIAEGLTARGQLGWRHTFGDLAPSSVLTFVNGSVPFAITGAPLSEDAVALELALRYSAGKNVALTGSYSGSIGNTADESRFQVGLSIGF